MGQARLRGPREERVRQALAEGRARNPVDIPEMSVFMQYKHQLSDGKFRWSGIKDAPFDVRKRASEIATQCQAKVEMRLQKALTLLLGELPSLDRAKDCLTQAVDANTGRVNFCWNGKKVLEVWPIETSMEAGKISVRQFTWCPLEGAGEKPMDIKQEVVIK